MAQMRYGTFFKKKIHGHAARPERSAVRIYSLLRGGVWGSAPLKKESAT